MNTDLLIATIKVTLGNELLNDSNITDDTCAVCRQSLTVNDKDWGTTSPHHIRSRSLGGSDSWYNLINLCYRCHSVAEGAGDSQLAEAGITCKMMTEALNAIREERIKLIVEFSRECGFDIDPMCDESLEDAAEQYHIYNAECQW